MTVSSKSLRRLAATALAAGALLAVGASSASATTWNPAGGGRFTATSGFKLFKGAEASACTIAGGAWEALFFNQVFAAAAPSQASCTGGKPFAWNFEGEAKLVEGKYKLYPFVLQSHEYQSPWGWYTQCPGCVAPVGEWTNGSGLTPSTVTFTNQPIGKIGVQVITLSGTFNVATTEGGLLTLK